MSKQNKYTKSARGQECQVRIPGVCNFNPETTVLAHLNGGGMGYKALDIHGAYACSACHDVIDGRVKVPDLLVFQGDSQAAKISIRKMHLDGVIRTQEIMVKNGVLKL